MTPDDQRGARVDTLPDAGKDDAVERGGWGPPRPLRDDEKESYDQMPGIRRLQEGQRPSDPMRCCLMT